MPALICFRPISRRSEAEKRRSLFRGRVLRWRRLVQNRGHGIPDLAVDLVRWFVACTSHVWPRRRGPPAKVNQLARDRVNVVPRCCCHIAIFLDRAVARTHQMPTERSLVAGRSARLPQCVTFERLRLDRAWPTSSRKASFRLPTVRAAAGDRELRSPTSRGGAAGAATALGAQVVGCC